MNTFIIQRVIFFSCKNWVEGFRKTQQRQAAIKKIAVQLGTIKSAKALRKQSSRRILYSEFLQIYFSS